MSHFNVVLLDANGYDLSSDLVEGLTPAKERAKYLLSDVYARHCATTHRALNTYKAEVRPEDSSECLYDFFREED
ncbi:hypothetical protein [Methylocella tundrae]|uniref:Uncharacterized protein n=1 Tax=Methylocella tundrae TaxID=227605 RepID=A0A4U8Z7H4_METTU|nr:hypothetical protein [Methylocella tundrae]WPP02761.1 hypothetical protein SIN04_00190 [Methylocella tundrae]VFU17526.1 protein of unknown function [Methylocella tundrae]